MSIPLSSGQSMGNNMKTVEQYLVRVSESDRKILHEKTNQDGIQRRVSVRTANASTTSPSHVKKPIKGDIPDTIKLTNDIHCYTCDGKDTNLIACHRCTLSFHKKCSRSDTVDTEANWICPYCVYEAEGVENKVVCNSIIEIERLKLLLADITDPSVSASAHSCAIDDITVNKVNPNEYLVKLLSKNGGMEYADTR